MSIKSDHEDDSEADDTKEDVNDEEESLTRADWGPLRTIPEAYFIKILAQHIEGSVDAEEGRYECVDTIYGGYNHVRIYTLLGGVNAGTYIIKVPCVGTSARWQPQDAYMLRSEYGTMKLIHERTNCPVPEVLAYDDSLANDLGAPFIIMRACTGVKAADVWFEQTEDGEDDVERADQPSEECSEKRKNFLRSLAFAMAELRTLTFDYIGSLDFNHADDDGNPTVGPSYHWNIDSETVSEDLETDKVISEQTVHKSSHDLFILGLLKAYA